MKVGSRVSGECTVWHPVPSVIMCDPFLSRFYRVEQVVGDVDGTWGKYGRGQESRQDFDW